MRKISSAAWELILPAVLIVGWWIWSALGTSIFFPPLSEILKTFATTWFGSGFSQNVVPSLRNLVIGYLIGVLVGVGGGLVLGLVKSLSRTFTPVVNFMRSIPPPAVLPFAILLLGVGPQMKIGIIAFGVCFTILLNTIDGVRSVDSTLADYARVYQIPVWIRLSRVTLPAASPQIIAGMRNGLSLGVLLMMISEMVASTQGIGYFTVQAQRTFAFTDMWAGMLLLGLLGYALNLLFGIFETRALFWQNSANNLATRR